MSPYKGGYHARPRNHVKRVVFYDQTRYVRYVFRVSKSSKIRKQGIFFTLLKYAFRVSKLSLCTWVDSAREQVLVTVLGRNNHQISVQNNTHITAHSQRLNSHWMIPRSVQVESMARTFCILCTWRVHFTAIGALCGREHNGRKKTWHSRVQTACHTNGKWANHYRDCLSKLKTKGSFS